MTADRFNSRAPSCHGPRRDADTHSPTGHAVAREPVSAQPVRIAPVHIQHAQHAQHAQQSLEALGVASLAAQQAGEGAGAREPSERLWQVSF